MIVPYDFFIFVKEEIEYQKKITEKTRKTLESSRIKRVNPKQGNVVSAVAGKIIFERHR